MSGLWLGASCCGPCGKVTCGCGHDFTPHPGASCVAFGDWNSQVIKRPERNRAILGIRKWFIVIVSNVWLSVCHDHQSCKCIKVRRKITLVGRGKKTSYFFLFQKQYSQSRNKDTVLVFMMKVIDPGLGVESRNPQRKNT
jgi:hypothetical protein